MRNKASRHMRRLCTTEGIVSRAGKVSRTEGSTLSALVVGRVYRYLCTRARIHSISFCARARLVDIPAIRGSRCGVLVPHRTPREGCFVARLHAEASLALHELAPTHCTNPATTAVPQGEYLCVRRGVFIHVALPHPRLRAARFPCEGAYCYYVANAKDQAPKREIAEPPRGACVQDGGRCVCGTRAASGACAAAVRL
jgi:hypothetical protein